MSLIVSPPPSSLKSTSFKKESVGKLPETPEGREEGDELDDDELVLQQTYPDPGPPQNGGLGPKGPNSENNSGQGMDDYGSRGCVLPSTVQESTLLIGSSYCF